MIRLEKQMHLENYMFKEIDGTYNDYLELFLQLGYLLLFSAAFQLCPILAFINNLFEL